MANFELPDFKIDESEIPCIRLKSVRFQNFKVFDDYTINFEDHNGGCKPFACIIGPNGSGKTTILDCIQILFSRFEGYEEDRLGVLLGKSVRHIDSSQNGIYGDDDFLITAQVHSSLGDYELQINKNGFIKDHPPEIKWIVYRLCFYTRYDQELNQAFNLPRTKWNIFKNLFESVTEFEITESRTVFDGSDDPIQADLLKKYVMGFDVKKPHEIISHRECSAGERKIIKSFSTLLTKEYTPQIILIDNVAMHVATGRHLELVRSMKRCFPDSQIFTTTHSHQLSRNFGEQSQIYDLRFISENGIIRREPWRLYIIDEIEDWILKVDSVISCDKIFRQSCVDKGRLIITHCRSEDYSGDIISESREFVSGMSSLFLDDIYSSIKKIN